MDLSVKELGEKLKKYIAPILVNARKRALDLEGTQTTQIKKATKGYNKDKVINISHPTSMRTTGIGPQGPYLTGDVQVGNTVSNKFIDTSKTGPIEEDGKVLLDVESTAIDDISFDPSTNTAEIKFVGGDTRYKFKNIDRKEFEEFLQAPSKGSLVATKWVHNPYYNIYK